ncbi:hypothetical protein C8R44DRAFT_890172 [Mycena epipterygia]|nr:hypothetical protein C8R44DRAFT_890172 [Mycena epipterygia]
MSATKLILVIGATGAQGLAVIDAPSPDLYTHISSMLWNYIVNWEGLKTHLSSFSKEMLGYTRARWGASRASTSFEAADLAEKAF